MSISSQIAIDRYTLAQDLNNAREDIQTLQKELQRYRRLEEETRAENKRLAARSETLTNKAKMYEAILEDTKLPQLLSMLGQIDTRTFASVDCLAETLVFRTPDIFEDELIEAKADIIPWIGRELVGALAKQSESTAVKPSRSLIRMASYVLLSKFLCTNQEHPEAVRKRMVLKLLSTMFKLAQSLEQVLKLLLAVDAELNTPEYMDIPSANDMTWILASPRSLFNSRTMLAIDSFGNVQQQAPESTEVVGFASVGLLKLALTENSAEHLPSQAADEDAMTQGRTILPARVFLKSTLQDIFEREVNNELTYVIPDLDGLA